MATARRIHVQPCVHAPESGESGETKALYDGGRAK
jgi:hypothetical protein